MKMFIFMCIIFMAMPLFDWLMTDEQFEQLGEWHEELNNRLTTWKR